MVKNNQKGFVNKKVLIGVVILFIVLAGCFWFKTGGYQYVNFYILHEGMPPAYCDPGPCSGIGSTSSKNPVWRENVYSQFKNLTDWKVNEDIKTWRLTDLSETDRDNLKNFEQGKIFEFRKTFNDEQSLSGGNAVENLKQLNISEKMLEDSVRKVLVDNKWSFVAGPSEGSFYHDYMYVYERHPLILQIGTRDAVLGGMYISIQFQY